MPTVATQAAPAATRKPLATTERLLSVDALRGFDMFWILGAEELAEALHKMSDTGITRFIYSQLNHKAWEGFAFLDLVFPMFVFIVGVSLVFSLTRILMQEGTAGAHKRIIRRALLLYVLGVFYYGGFANDWPQIRLVGVLHRIAFAYLCAGLIFCHFRTRGIIVAIATILLGYWAMMALIPVPGVGAGNFAEGQNLANYIDKMYLPGRKWDGQWDPEGLLSNIPAVATCLLGVLCGLLLKNTRIQPQRKVAYLFIGGIASVAAGWLWHLEFPVIKKLWTSSYVLVAGGYSCLLLAAFYQIIDVWKVQKWAQPFIWIGMNPITIYMLHNIVDFQKLSSRFVGGNIKHLLDASVTPGFGAVMIVVVAMFISILICGWLYRRKIFLRL